MPNQTDNVAKVAAESRPAAAEMIVNPLLEKKIRTYAGWGEWIAHWQTTIIFSDLESLLHCGFNNSMEDGSEKKRYDYIDRIIFYFSVADGWNSYYTLERVEAESIRHYCGHDPTGNSVYKSPNELRKMLARKAFDMLCLNFFRPSWKDESSSEARQFWNKLIFFDRLLLVIQNFFRVEKKEFSGDDLRIRNLPYRDELPHNEQLAVNFLTRLIKVIWEWKEPASYAQADDDADYYFAAKLRLDAAKPWTIEVLAELGMLGKLRKWILEFDQPCLDKLKEIALRTELSHFTHRVREDRRVASVDEACYAGSCSALFLKEYEITARENQRLAGIIEAEDQIAEATRKKAELSGQKKE